MSDQTKAVRETNHDRYTLPGASKVINREAIITATLHVDDLFITCEAFVKKTFLDKVSTRFDIGTLEFLVEKNAITFCGKEIVLRNRGIFLNCYAKCVNCPMLELANEDMMNAEGQGDELYVQVSEAFLFYCCDYHPGFIPWTRELHFIRLLQLSYPRLVHFKW